MPDPTRPDRRELRFISCPYDSGLHDVGMGRGPARLLGEHAASHDATAAGWNETLDSVEPVDEQLPEIARIIELNRRLAVRVGGAIAEDVFPLVLAGNCNSCLGTVSGAPAARALGVVWFDAHADFDTPDDNRSGFFDVMALAILTGSGWGALRETIPGFSPVAEDEVVLAGVRDLEPYQRSRLERSRIRTIPCPPWRDQDFDGALVELRQRVGDIYLHIDLDALDVSEGIANRYAAPGGLTLEQLMGAVRAVFARFRVRAAALTAYDPAHDSDGRLARAATAILDCIAEEAQQA